MTRGTHVLLIPSQPSEAGARTLIRELNRAGVNIVGKDNEVFLAKWDEQAKAAVAKGLSVQSFFTDSINPANLKKLPPHARRVAELWNWSIDNRGKRVTERQVSALMAKLKVELRDGEVYDAARKRRLGKTESKETEDKQGNWWLFQNRGWYNVPGWFGYWQKLWCKSRTYPTSSPTGDRLIVDYILAEVDGPQHYAADYKYNASLAYCEDWDYIWIGEGAYGDATSYALKAGASATITRAI